MEKRFNQTEAQKGNFPINAEANWPEIARLLKEKQYDQSGQSLYGFPPSEDDCDSYLASISTAAYQLCLASQQVHAEIRLHEQACQEALQRELELQQQLTWIWDFIARQIEPGIPRTPNKVSLTEEKRSGQGNGRSWWRRLHKKWETKFGSAVEPVIFDDAKADGETAVQAPNRNPQAKDSYPTMTVYCLGTFRTYTNECLVENWKGNNAKAIFKYMVVNRKQPIPVEILMDMFWRDDEPEPARRNLYQAIYLLRQALQTATDFPYILSTNGCYGLNPGLKIWLDSEAFDNHYRNGQKHESKGDTIKAVHEFEAADALYEGDFLAEDVYEEWPAARRQQLKNDYLDTLNRLSQFHYQRKNWALCTNYGQKLLRADDCREETHRILMRAYAQSGQRHLALRQYHHCAEALHDELSVPPTPQTIDLYHQIKEGHLQF